MSADRPLRRRELLYHGARVALSLTAFALARRLGCDAAAVIASVAVVFACFGLGHDLMHGVLALPRRLNAVLLSLCHLAMLSSGHGVKASHAMHHRAPLSDADAEGRAASRSLLGAVLWAPIDLWSVRVAGFRLAPLRDRWLVVGESIACFFVAVGLAAFEAGRIHIAVALVLQLSIGVWASHIPHHVPSWLHAIARPIARAPSLVARSLVFHDLHHARPDVPSAWLGRVAAVGLLVAAAPGCARSPAESDGNRTVAQDVAAIHESIRRADGDLMLRAQRRGLEREVRPLVSVCPRRVSPPRRPRLRTRARRDA